MTPARQIPSPPDGIMEVAPARIPLRAAASAAGVALVDAARCGLQESCGSGRWHGFEPTLFWGDPQHRVCWQGIKAKLLTARDRGERAAVPQESVPGTVVRFARPPGLF